MPIKMLYQIENVGDIGVCHMEPGDETCVFALEEEDDGTAPHQYGPCDEFYYILEGEFTVWWGKDTSKLDNFYKLGKGDCAYYPTVITSYSIHYTKLYDVSQIQAAQNLEVLGGWHAIADTICRVRNNFV